LSQDFDLDDLFEEEESESYQEKETLRTKLAKVVIESDLTTLTLDELKRIKNEYERGLDDKHKYILINRIDELLLEDCRIIISSLPIDSASSFIHRGEELKKIFKDLSDNAQTLFLHDFIEVYVKGILNILKKVYLGLWFSMDKKFLLMYIKNDTFLTSIHSIEIANTVKQLVKDDFVKVFVKSDLEHFFLTNYNDYLDVIKDFLGNSGYEEIIKEVEAECLSNAPFLNIAGWFKLQNKQLPDGAKSKFLELNNHKIVYNLSILGMFDDPEGVLLSQIIDKILSKNGYLFYYDEENLGNNGLYKWIENISFAKHLVFKYGKDISHREFIRLQCNDRLTLYFNLHLDVITPIELKECLIGNKIGLFGGDEYLDSECGRLAVSSILIDADCTTEAGVNNAIEWLNKYVGEKPNDNESLKIWSSKTSSFVYHLSTSTNEHLKVLLWAMYFMSSGKIDLLKDIYCLLPVDLQIRVLKKLFNLMALGKIDSSLGWLETNLGVNKHNLSLPIMIVLRFLRLKMENPDAYMKDTIMLELFAQQADQSKWYMVNKFLTPCNGRIYRPYVGPESIDDSQFTFSGYIEKTICEEQNVYSFVLTKKVVTKQKEETQYDNKLFDCIQDYISINFSKDQYKSCDYNGNRIYYFKDSVAHDVRLMAESYQIMMPDVDYKHTYKQLSDSEKFCCECRLSDKLDNSTNRLFLWCSNHSCFSKPAHFHSSNEWEDYTVLDFMRILNISTDYTSKIGKTTRFGQYIIFSSYMQSFHELYEHLKCRGCGKLMEPCDISNFSRSTVTDFHCVQSDCDCKDIVYLNHCFNQKCNHIIDSRDSKQCPNGGYICEKCGSCCSQEKFKERLDR
jgi:hypothetical protein